MIKIVNSKQSLEACYIALCQLFKKHNYLRVKIERESRTLAQNAWTFQAYKMLAAQGDMTLTEYRNYCKYHFGLSIRAAKESEFAELMKPMLMSLTYEDRLKAMSFVDVTSTFDVDQMIEYINEIINHFHDKQLPEKLDE